MQILAPCKNCPVRLLGCHSNCSTYAAWQLEQHNKRAFIKENDRHRKVITASRVEGHVSNAIETHRDYNKAAKHTLIQRSATKSEF